ncbi:MAG: PPC domain-containing protein [Bacteroidota bacterium]
MKLIPLLALLLAAPAAAQTYSGTLEDGDPVRDFGELYDAYTFEAQEGQEVVVRLDGRAGLDTYLIVRSPSGAEWNNDDFEGASVSQVSLVAGEAGTWDVWASGFNNAQRGAYDLTVTLGGIAEVTTVQGRLDPSDRQSIKGEYVDTFAIDAPTSGRFSVELLCYGFDGYLRVTSPSGQRWRNDDAGSTDVSRIENLVGAPGEWTVDITTSFADEVGAYDLRVLSFPE